MYLFAIIEKKFTVIVYNTKPWKSAKDFRTSVSWKYLNGFYALKLYCIQKDHCNKKYHDNLSKRRDPEPFEQPPSSVTPSPEAAAGHVGAKSFIFINLLQISKL